MTSAMDTLCDRVPGPEIFNATKWSLKQRRVFLLTFPVSVPVWLAIGTVYWLSIIFILLPLLIAISIKEDLWDRKHYE